MIYKLFDLTGHLPAYITRIRRRVIRVWVFDRVNGLNLTVPEDAKEVIKAWDMRENTEKFVDSGVDDQVWCLCYIYICLDTECRN
jgi:hypothetical protein